MHRIFLTLGYAGLIPFLLPVILVLSGIGEVVYWIYLAQTYAFAIICFLTGTWWGFAFRSNSKPALISSNILFLIAFVGFTLLNQHWTVISALLLIAILIIEQYVKLLPDLADDYQRMRCVLTSIAGSSMFALHGIS